MVGIRVRKIVAVSVFGAIVLSAELVFAGQGSAASSQAYGISAEFTSGGNTVSLEPVANIEGSAPPAYDDTVAADNFHQIVPLTEGNAPVPSLFVNGVDFRSHVASAGFGVDSISSTGDAFTKSVNVALMLNPPPPTAGGQPAGPVPQPFLELSAAQITSSASYRLVVPNHSSVGGTAMFINLSISGTLVGRQVLRFSGSAAPNTLLFQSPSVTITLNRRSVVGLISCTPQCVFTPYSNTTVAVDIVLTNARLNGKVVSGEIILGQSSADAEGFSLAQSP
jgi:hypothetical protein